jgi:competence protein ComEC
MFAKYAINFSLFFILGILVNVFWFKSWIYLPAFLISAIIFLVFFKKKIVFFCIVFFALGIFRNYLALTQEVVVPGETITGVVVSEPKQSENSVSFVLESEKKKISVIVEKHSDIKRCDLIEIQGETVKTERKYLIKDKILLSSFFPKTRIIERKNCQSLILSLKDKAGGSIDSMFPSPQSSILKAMLLGEKQTIPREWQDKLSFSGVRHITAVSGMHVAVITVIFFNLALALKIKRRNSFLFSFLGIIFFIVLTGLQTSAIRAGIMGSAVMGAGFWGRMNRSHRTLILTALIMLVFNPLLLGYDIGFQLSFAAVIGIISFAPFFKKTLSFLPKIVGEITAVSFSAYVFSLPLLIYHFQEVSLIFPLTNLFILPILYWLMLLGIFFVFLSFFSNLIASFLFVPLWLVSTYLIKVVDFFSGFSWATTQLTLTLILFYSLFLLFLFQKRKEYQEELDEKWLV